MATTGRSLFEWRGIVLGPIVLEMGAPLQKSMHLTMLNSDL